MHILILEVLYCISLLLSSHSKTLLQNWIGQTKFWIRFSFCRGLLCSSFQHLHFHLCACFFPLEDINDLIDVGMWFTYHFFQPWMQPFNMVVGAWTLEVEVVPLVTLELPFIHVESKYDTSSSMWGIWGASCCTANQVVLTKGSGQKLIAAIFLTKCLRVGSDDI